MIYRARVLCGMVDLGDQIRAYVAPPADRWVEAYFEANGPFAADTFDTIGLNDPFQISTDDLLAVTFLDVSVPPPGARRLLGADAAMVTDMLWDIPSDTDLWDATEPSLASADVLWQYLVKSVEGIGPVTAGKLLARKRPRLIPIVDSVIEGLLQLPANTYWSALQGALADETVRKEIEDLRRPWFDGRISTLRLLDVALWMTGSEGENARRATGRA